MTEFCHNSLKHESKLMFIPAETIPGFPTSTSVQQIAYFSYK